MGKQGTISPTPNSLDLGRLSSIAMPIMKRFGVVSAAVFGSVARGEAKPDSDIDLLVEYPKGMSAFGAMALKDELEASLGRTVDLVPPKYLKEHVRPAALAEQIRLF